jgi:hypothetical protein
MGKRLSVCLFVLVLASFLCGPVHASDPVSSKEIRVAVVLTSMHADLMEGVEEAMAYLLLGAVEEKEEFLVKMKAFDGMAAEFANLSENRYTDQLARIMETKGKMQDAAMKAFGRLETERNIELADVQALEAAVDQVSTLMDQLAAGVVMDVHTRAAEMAACERAMLQLLLMKSDVLEGVEEAFGYLLLDEAEERADFFKKMDDFDQLAAKFKRMEFLNAAGREDTAVLFYELMAAKERLVVESLSMFVSFETGKMVPYLNVRRFEIAVDKLTLIYEQLLMEVLREMH